MEDDRRSEMSLSDFLARAWNLANEKSRSLGWIGYNSDPKIECMECTGRSYQQPTWPVGGCDDTAAERTRAPI